MMVPMTRAAAEGASEMGMPLAVIAEPGDRGCESTVTWDPETMKGMLPTSTVVGVGEG